MKRLHWILLALLILGTQLLQWFGPEHPYPHAWDNIPLFYAAFGFVGALALIWIAKGPVSKLVQKAEHYYDRNS